MKITDPALSKAAMKRIKQHPDFNEVMNLVTRNTSGEVFLVGGKVYRTIVELVHGYDCGAEEADWDFLCLGDVVKKHRVYVFGDWSPDISPYEDYKANSLCLKHYTRSLNVNGIVRGMGGIGGPGRRPISHAKKIDIIGIKDVPKFNSHEGVLLGRLDDYFKAVPLTVQAIALSKGSYPCLYGKALPSIEAKTIHINNEHGTLRPFDIHYYASQKASSLKFKYHGYSRAYKVPCDCYEGDITLLWRNGCQNKGAHY